MAWELYQKAYRPFTHWLDRIDTPRWVRCPQDIQIDTHNYCSSTHDYDEKGELIHKYPGCAFCNVKAGGAFGIPRGRMSTELLEYIINYWGEKRSLGCEYICPYVNGDPIIDNRLSWICDLSRDNGLKVVVDTSGNVYRNRRMLVHPYLTLLRFSISAATPETYERVQGCPKFKETVNTIKWVAENKCSTQQIELHYMVCKYNEHEIDQFIDTWRGFKIKIFPLHEMEGIQLASTACLPKTAEWINRGDTLEQWRQTRPLFLYPNGKAERRVMSRDKTCQGMAYAVQWDGLVLHCTDAPPDYKDSPFHLGYVKADGSGVDMLESWHKRNRQRINHPACRVCNAKRPDYYQVLREYDLATDTEIENYLQWREVHA